MGRVLIADDDADIVELAAFKLGLDGHDIRTAGDGEAALAEIASFRPEIVVLDIMMPKMTGLDVLAAMRRDEATTNIAVLLLTARAQEADIERGFAAGADDYLVKPFSPRELSSRVQAILSRSKADDVVR